MADHDWQSLDAASLLPGCSVPLSHAGGVHAFGEFESLSADGLAAVPRDHLRASLPRLVYSLSRLHEQGLVYGRITSSAIHNRGTSQEPDATLWIDPQLAADTGAVHAGDPEAMYWTADRIKTGEGARPSDDWYALGVVVAEWVLSSTSVRKIWELSRQNGGFLDDLKSNLKSARGDSRLAKAALELLNAGGASKVPFGFDDRVVRKLNGPRFAQSLWFQLGALLLILALIGLAWSTWLDGNQKQRELLAMRETLEGTTKKLEEQKQLAEESERIAMQMSSQKPPEDVPEAEPGQSEQEWWMENITDRPLEQAIEMSREDSRSAVQRWRAMLAAFSVMPGQRTWRKADPTLRENVQLAVNSPWQDASVAAANERLSSLSKAYAIWLQWASSEKNREELEKQFEFVGTGPVKEILRQWLAEAYDVSEFKLRVRVGKVPAGNEWTDFLVGFETEADSGSQTWTWSQADGEDAQTDLQIDGYKAGQSLSFWLQQDSSIPLWNTTVIEQTLKSPLLVWRLSRGLQLTVPDGYSVSLKTNTKFGPPPWIRESAAEDSDGGGVAVPDAKMGAKETSKRPKVDPKDELPFLD